MPSLLRPSAPRWAIYALGAPSDLLTVVVVKDGLVLSQTGKDLPWLVAELVRECKLALPQWARRQSLKPQTMAAAWIVSDDQLFGFEWPCSPIWGPLDIEAESRLEASAQMQLPPAQLALSYEVYRSTERALSVKVNVCQQSKVDACIMQLQALDLQLQVFTSQSQVAGLAAFLGLALSAQQALHQRIDSQKPAWLAQGELAC